jgi:hypothetical protein
MFREAINHAVAATEEATGHIYHAHYVFGVVNIVAKLLKALRGLQLVHELNGLPRFPNQENAIKLRGVQAVNKAKVSVTGQASVVLINSFSALLRRANCTQNYVGMIDKYSY